jgi:hypothetical protein
LANVTRNCLSREREEELKEGEGITSLGKEPTGTENLSPFRNKLLAVAGAQFFPAFITAAAKSSDLAETDASFRSQAKTVSLLVLSSGALCRRKQKPRRVRRGPAP